MSAFQEPRRVCHARLPTPLEPLERYSAHHAGVTVWIKRDDLTGCLLSGNKVRKLEYVFGQACAAHARGVVTCGGVNSNHCRATVVLAARLGLQRHLFLRTADGKAPATLQGNTLLDHIAGASVTWITPQDYARRDGLMSAFAQDRADGGEHWQVIPEGASDAIGACGYVHAVREIQSQLNAQQLHIDAIVHAMGSGGTTAGLLAGRALYGAAWRVVGVPVCDDEHYFRMRVDSIRQAMSEQLGIPAPQPDEPFDVIDGYCGRGYGLTTPQELQLIQKLCEMEGILLDPCYTGKAFFALDSEIRSGRFATGSNILFLHTGGAFSNFSYGEEWNALL